MNLQWLTQLGPAFWRATKIKALYESSTTGSVIQGGGVVGILAGLGIVLLAPDLPEAATLALMGLVVPTLSAVVARIIAFAKDRRKGTKAGEVEQEKDALALENADVMIVAVGNITTEWVMVTPAKLQNILGWKYGADAFGNIFDLTTGKLTGLKRALRQGTTEESDAKMASAVAAVKARVAELRAGEKPVGEKE